MANDDIKIKISAEDTGLTAVLNKATAAVNSSADQMRTKLESLNGIVAGVQKVFVGFAAVLAGGAAFKQVVESTVEWQESVESLSKALGTSLEKTSDYLVATRHLGIDTQTLVGASDRMTRQIYTNADAFERLGVRVKDTQGNFRPTVDVMAQVNDKLREIPAGMDRNIAGQQVYGRGWADVRDILKLTTAELEDATVKAAKLGLVVGPEGTAQADAYKQAMNDVRLVGQSLSMQLGKELLPTLIQLGNAFSDQSDAIGSTFAEALRIVAYVGGTVFIEFQKLGKGIGATLAASMAVLHGDVAGARAIMRDLDTEVDALNAKAAALWDNLHKPAPKGSAEPAAPSGKNPFEGSDSDKSRMASFETKLAELRAAYSEQQRIEGSFRQFSIAQERTYWREILSTQRLSTQDQISVRRKLAEANLALDKQQFDQQIATLNLQMDAVRGSFDQQLALAQQMAQRIGAAYGIESTQYSAVQKQIIDIERQKQASIDQIRQTAAQAEKSRALSEIDAREDIANLSAQLMETTNAELLAKEQDFENARHDIQRAALLQDLAIAAENPQRNAEQIAQINAQLEDLEQQHQGRIRQIQMAAALEARKYWLSTFQSMQQGWTSVMSQFLRGTMTFKQFMRGMFTATLDAITDTLAQMAAQWLTNLLVQQITGKTTAASLIAGHAATAGAAAVASTAAIPIVGPFLAPAAGLAAYAAAIAFEGVAAAAQGYDVPAGVNPITQLHAREMVLPARQADVIRNIADNGEGGAAMRPHQINVKIHATDAKSVQKMLANPNNGLMRAIKSQLRASGRPIPVM